MNPDEIKHKLRYLENISTLLNDCRNNTIAAIKNAEENLNKIDYQLKRIEMERRNLEEKQSCAG